VTTAIVTLLNFGGNIESLPVGSDVAAGAAHTY
jgi:hypothetical protein